MVVAELFSVRSQHVFHNTSIHAFYLNYSLKICFWSISVPTYLSCESFCTKYPEGTTLPFPQLLIIALKTHFIWLILGIATYVTISNRWLEMSNCNFRKRKNHSISPLVFHVFHTRKKKHFLCDECEIKHSSGGRSVLLC